MPYTDLGIDFFLVGEPGAPYDSRINEVQDYNVIKKTYDSKKLFIDKEFPAGPTSIGSLFLLGPVEWKRPSEISKDLFKGAAPIFMESIGDPRFDIYQGHVGDCWFLCSLADITMAKECFDIVVPSDNVSGFECGAFHFRFWRKGTWIDVVVDDRLPCYVENGVITSTVFLKVKTNEFWSALVEKAYAKLYGNYKRIDFGLPLEAMEDFSGGITEYCNISEGLDFKTMIQQAYQRRSFMAAGTAADTTTPAERRRLTVEQLDNEGIVSSHAYSILGIKDVVDKTDATKTYTLVHLRNPWGNDVEWKGKWSDSDDKSWATVTEDLRIGTPDSTGVISRLDGDFWIDYDDMLRKFAALNFCHWSTSDHGQMSIGRTEIKPYSSFIANGSWVRGTKGNINNKADLVNMPLYIVHMEHREHKEDLVFKHAEEGTCIIVVNLQYKNYQQSGVDPAIPTFGLRALWGEGMHGKDNKLDAEFFETAQDIFENPAGSRYPNALAMDVHMREVTFRYDLPEGTCAIIPFVEFPKTPNPPATIPYLLRIYAEGEVVCTDSKQGDETKTIPPTTSNDPEKPAEPEKPAPAPTKPEKPAEQPDPYAKAKKIFKVWAGEDGLLDVKELKTVLDGLCVNEKEFNGFSDATCRSLLNAVDPTQTGKIEFEQCRTLMKNVVQWINKFKLADLDHNGYVKNEEVDTALRSIGFSLNSYTLIRLRRKYGDFFGNYSLDKFVQMVNDLHSTVGAFNNAAYEKGGIAQFDLNTWISTLFGL